jgi:aspartate racemase
MHAKLGVLGGMGPLATVDFLYKLVDRTHARKDDEHIPLIVHSVPQLPDRIQAILKHGPSPLPALREAVATLQSAGAICLAMPCNTAHYWYDELAAQAQVPFLHIADTALAAITCRGLATRRLGLVGTRGTLAGGFYQQRFTQHGIECVISTQQDQEQLIDPAIRAIKANDLEGATPLIECAVEKLMQGGADAVVLACTEIPVVLPRFNATLATQCVDVTMALADACVDWWHSHNPGAKRTHVSPDYHA